MKKLIALFLCGCMILSGFVCLSGCRNKKQENDQESASRQEEYEIYAADIVGLINNYPTDGEETDPFYSCRLIVSCNNDEVLSGLGAAEIVDGPDDIYLLQYTSAEQAERAYEIVKDAEGVRYAEPDTLLSVEEGSSVEDGENISWGTAACGADEFAQALSQIDHEQVTVAIVDTGVSQHELLEGRVVDGVDFVDLDEDWSDEYGHGTHVAGIVADATQGLNINILPIRVLNDKGKGFNSIIAAGIRSAVVCGADVINMSLGKPAVFPFHSELIDEAVQFAIESNVIVVAAAGNDYGDVMKKCPAHIEECITVSAINDTGKIASFSNTGKAVDFAAPGVEINSAGIGGYNEYVIKMGTSMAAPYISAMCAMLRSAGLANTTEEIESMLASCCLDLGDEGKDEKYGYGLPQINKLINQLPIPVEVKTGVYCSTSSEDDILTIHNVTGDVVAFSVFWYRISDFDTTVNRQGGNIGNFTWTDETGATYAEGTIEFLYDNKIILNLTSTNLPYTETGIYEYEYYGTEEEYHEGNSQEVLLLNDGEKGWMATPEDAKPPEPMVLYLHFYEDGRYACWTTCSWSGDVTVFNYSGTYRIEGNTLYLDVEAYQLQVENTGAPFIELTALGDPLNDFSGKYYLKVDTLYAMFVEEANNS